MSEKKETVAQWQKRTKPILDDVFASRENMDAEAKQVAFSFLDYCNAKNITYRWSSTNRWNLYAKSTSLGYIAIGVRNTDDDSWSILLNHRVILKHEDLIQKENFAESIYNNLHFCEGCDGNRCSISCTSKLRFRNPTSETVESVQKILDFVLTPR